MDEFEFDHCIRIDKTLIYQNVEVKKLQGMSINCNDTKVEILVVNFVYCEKYSFIFR
jgi:hypothetical protein